MIPWPESKLGNQSHEQLFFLFNPSPVGALGFQHLSRAYVTILLPLVLVVDFRVMNAKPLVAAQVFNAVNSSSRNSYS